MADDPEEKRECALRVIQKRIEKTQATIDKLQAKEKECLLWQAVEHQGLLLQANLYRLKKGMAQATVDDWMTGKLCEITLNPQLEVHEQAAAFFHKARKLKRGLKAIEKQINRYSNALARWSDAYDALSMADSDDELLQQLIERYLPPPPPKGVAAAKGERRRREPFFHYLTASGLSIWVGRSASDNDKLTFSFANGSDYWLHVANYAGSHVILRPKQKDAVADADAIDDAMQVALAYSRAKDRGDGEVIVTQCKYVRRAKGSLPGKVMVAKQKSYYVLFDRNRFEAIKARKNE